MAANIFKVDGDRVDSFEEFLRCEQNGSWEHILYYPDRFQSQNNKVISFNENKFKNISFKDTIFYRVSFVRCEFYQCLFIGASFIECEFIDCTFIKTNTNKLKISNTLINPKDFEDNFDLENDTNIAIGFYQAMYKNSSEEHQPEYAVESLYQMKRAQKKHLSAKLSRKKISKLTYFKKRAFYEIYDFISGYGLRAWRVVRLFSLVLACFTILNWHFSDAFFSQEEKLTFWDSFYFTVVVMTTLGFGDITPSTELGKVVIALESVCGFIVISFFLAAILKVAVRLS